MQLPFDTRRDLDLDSPPLTDSDSDDGSLCTPPTARPSVPRFQRAMGPSELSYFLPSRADGVNDMYLHLGFRAPAALLSPHRLRAVWALLRLRHPPLAAQVQVHDYDDVRFTYVPPPSPTAALNEADRHLRLDSQSKDVLINDYLNGPRTLSNRHLSFLIHSSRSFQTLPTPRESTVFDFDTNASPDSDPPVETATDHDILLCAAHFLGDGMALHRTANELFTLLSSDLTTDQLEQKLACEWEARWAARASSEPTLSGLEGWDVLPPALEDCLPPAHSKFQTAAGRIDFDNSQAKLIGGHAFPRASKRRERHTLVPTIPFDEQVTKRILKKCKDRGVSVANALFAVCNFAWAKVCAESSDPATRKPELPIMMYSALNLRPYLKAQSALVVPGSNVVIDPSFWFLAVGYFNVILPNFLPCAEAHHDAADKDLEGREGEKGEGEEEDMLTRTFWHRAREAKKQSTSAAKHPLIVSRTREMARVRAERAIGWAKQDDEEAVVVQSGRGSGGLKRKKTVTMRKIEVGKGGLEVLPMAPLPTPPPEKQAFLEEQIAAVVVQEVSPPSESQALPPAPAPAPSVPSPQSAPNTRPPSPSTALLGLSLLGNLDGIYKHSTYTSGAPSHHIVMHSLTTGSRQRAGGMLLFGYTFAGRLWVSLGYDVNGFGEGVVEGFWEGVVEGVGEYLC